MFCCLYIYCSWEHVPVGVLAYPSGTIILLHGNPSVCTAPVGRTVVSPSPTQTHTAGVERTVGRGVRRTNRCCWLRFGLLDLTGGVEDPRIICECLHDTNEARHRHYSSLIRGFQSLCHEWKG